MRPAVAALALLALLARASDAAAVPDVIRLVLPHPLHAGEAIWLQIRVGPIAPGQTMTVTTDTGAPLGTIAPHGIRTGAAAGTFALPVPPDAVHDGRLGIRLSLSPFGGPSRAPDRNQVRSVRLVIAPATP